MLLRYVAAWGWKNWGAETSTLAHHSDFLINLKPSRHALLWPSDQYKDLTKKPIKVTKSRRNPQSFKITQKSSFYKVYFQFRIFLPKMVSLNEGNNFLSCMSVKMSLLVTELAFPRKWLLIDSTFHSTRRCKSSSSRPIFSGNSIYMWRSAKKKVSLQRWIIICLDYDFHWFSRVNFTGFHRNVWKALKGLISYNKKGFIHLYIFWFCPLWRIGR